MTLYEFYQYEESEVLEMEYLLEQAKRFKILDEVRESYFQFGPNLILEESEQIPGFGCHERWSDFHKRSTVNEIIFYLIETNFEDDYLQEALINEHIWNDTYRNFITRIDLREYSKSKINKKFIEYVKQFSDAYHEHID
jgi:hypothetical protein